MNDITASLKKIAQIINSDIDIVNKSGFIVYSSKDMRAGSVSSNFVHSKSRGIKNNPELFLHIENAGIDTIKLVQLYLEDKIIEGTAGDYHQFLKKVINSKGCTEEDCRKLNIPYRGSFMVYCISLYSGELLNDACNLISNCFFEANNYWVFTSDRDIILLKSMNNPREDMSICARTMRNIINSELYADAWIGAGNIHGKICDIYKSYNEAKEAITIGRLFNIPENIYIYNNMLAERIVSNTPKDKIKLLLDEIFNKGGSQVPDEELIRTAKAMFQNNLNLSDSAKKLYIHRNTLIYRLDKIHKTTGLDIRKFEDAVVFKLGMLLLSATGNERVTGDGSQL